MRGSWRDPRRWRSSTQSAEIRQDFVWPLDRRPNGRLAAFPRRESGMTLAGCAWVALRLRLGRAQPAPASRSGCQRIRRQAQRRALGDEPVQAAQRELTGKAAKRRVGSVEALHLLDRGAATL